MDVVSKFDAWIAVERERFDDRHTNMFAFAFAEVTRYHRYLEIILARHTIVGTEFIENTRAIQEKTPLGSNPMTDERWKLHLQSREITDRLHLEIESFYLFAKILLDKVARAIEFYFGPERKLSLDSHDDLTKKLERYASAKLLKSATSLSAPTAELKKTVSDFRDYQVSHEKSPRTLRGTGFSLDGSQIRMFQTQLYPTEKDKQIESMPPKELLIQIDAYLVLVLDFVTANRDKGALTLLGGAMPS